MSETKRGAPTEDGAYIIKMPKCERLVRVQGGKVYWYAEGVPFHDVPEILAHRRHEPLEVPLKELHRCEGKPCVVRNSIGNVFCRKFFQNVRHSN